jgi:quercetin dioxygenase-like cupin family protein/pimeloyl-ACP methyl ester carboxylesterase
MNLTKSLKVTKKESPTKGATENFTGNVTVASRFASDTPGGYRGAVVNFEAGARTAWHTHPLGQTLVVISGRGLVQSEGEEIREINPGDVVWIPANERHWHGAASDSPMSHVAISTPQNNSTVQWMEHVSDDQYGETETSETTAPLMIQDQGSFTVGGTVITNSGTFDPFNRSPAGQTLHGDHAYVTYQIPVNARKLPLVFWHGIGQSSKTWETTPDGREGFQNIFLRRRFPVYLIDQPRRGRAGRSTLPGTIKATPDEQDWFGTFRVGIWPDFFQGVQLSRDPETLNQYFRQITPDTGPLDTALNVESVAALFEKTGPAVLVTHSHAGGQGWQVAVRSSNARAVVSYEPGSGFIFPEGEVPEAMPSAGGPLEAVGVPLSEFMVLTKIPIVIYYGDYIPAEPTENPGQDGWRVRLAMARKWMDAVNRRGGDVTVVHLPEIGLKGNTHFPMSDLNNIQVADEMSKFLLEKQLD